ncbi:hypothetical protein N7532_008969 [Penicillium argentinense]|uniref:Rhodopsin domain-containing protein n=1 Tax=Penicillium argentinense TaxID=1131581 RepID=A0A9W9K2E3_9EURO|nr:uncharacterized protein N7532_008969 [Penicillium argentinense]KAJ5090285.1 hypothetical protein N7532_008969 [Penicillium argentinense]
MSATGGTPPMATAVRAVVGTVALLDLIFCMTRLYIRKFVRNAFGVDDYFVIIALIWVLFFAALSIALTFYGIGYHQDDIPLEKLPNMQYAVYISLCTYLFVACSVKISVVIFIMRVFPTNFIRYYGFGIIAFMVLLTISGEVPLIFQCKPVRAAYDKTVPGYKCFTPDTLFDIEMYQGVLMFFIDIAIITMPIPTIWKLQMPIQRRLSIIGVFSLGLVACAVGLARLPTLVYQKNITDFTYAGATPLIWLNMEFGLALVTGSLPSMRVLLRSLPGFGSANKTSSKTRSQEWSSNNDQAKYPLGNQNRWSKKPLGRNINLETFESLASESQERIVHTHPPGYI